MIILKVACYMGLSHGFGPCAEALLLVDFFRNFGSSLYKILKVYWRAGELRERFIEAKLYGGSLRRQASRIRLEN